MVVVLGFYVPPRAKVIGSRDLGFKSHSKDWRSQKSYSQSLVYIQQRLLRPKVQIKSRLQYEPRHEKTGFLQTRKQRRRSTSR